MCQEPQWWQWYAWHPWRAAIFAAWRRPESFSFPVQPGSTDPRLLVIDRLRAAEVGWGHQAGAPARGRLRLCGRLVPSVGPPLMPLRVKRHNLSA